MWSRLILDKAIVLFSIRNYGGSTASQVAAAASYGECANYIERAAQVQSQSADTGPAQNHFISTNTYHSHPHVPTNSIPHPHTNGFNNNNSSSDNCDMEMGDAPITNGNHIQGPDAQDVLLHHGVSRNTVGVAGKKRSREDVEQDSYKRARHDGINLLLISIELNAC